MSSWPGKFVIGLTGNIATGKSVVRKMLEHLGAYSIDADALGHRAIACGAPAYAPVVDLFGRWILTADLEIDRDKVAKIVFNDPEALLILEAIIHPYVLQAVNLLVKRATQAVIVIEAIKLVETRLYKECDSLWVCYAPFEIQVARLVNNRKITEEHAHQRIAAQPPQEDKMRLANIVIKNDSSFEETWHQVNTAWKMIIPVTDASLETLVCKTNLPLGDMILLRGKPRHSNEIAEFYNKWQPRDNLLSSSDIMAEFGNKAFLMLKDGEKLVGLLGWQVENLVSRITDIVLNPSIPIEQSLSLLLSEMEKSARDLQSEASLLFVPKSLVVDPKIWESQGYEQRSFDTLGVQAWEEAALDSMTLDSTLYFKQLRLDRILRPI